MTKYLLLLIALVTLMVTWAFSTQSQGGLRFAENEKLVVHPNSILRKLLLKKDNQDYPLRIYKVIPWVINMVLFLIVLLVYAVFAILYQNPTGLMIKGFLESAGVQIFSLIWCLLNFLYTKITPKGWLSSTAPLPKTISARSSISPSSSTACSGIA